MQDRFLQNLSTFRVTKMIPVHTSSKSYTRVYAAYSMIVLVHLLAILALVY